MIIGIVGLGLMGASMGKAARKRGDRVYGYDIDDEVMQKASLVGAIDDALADTQIDLDLLIISTYADRFYQAAEKFLSCVKQGGTLMDFCGNKRTIARDMQKLIKLRADINYIGGHPMAGREVAGIDNSLVSLFFGASMVLTPIKADIFAIDDLKKYFLSLAFNEVVITTPENHDKNVAYTSQLCHIVSNAYIKSPTAENHFGYSAGSYRDLTRVARLSPEMWTELMLSNADNLKNELDILIENLEKYSAALGAGDAAALKALLAEGNDRKIKIDKGKLE